jgi:hypothetical protein
MKRPLFIITALLLLSCKKETIVKQSECTKHFVEMYSSGNYEINFYRNGVEVPAYEPPNFNMTGVTVHSGDSVRMTSIKISNGLFTNWIKVDGVTVADSTFWVTGSDTVNISYVVH